MPSILSSLGARVPCRSLSFPALQSRSSVVIDRLRSEAMTAGGEAVAADSHPATQQRHTSPNPLHDSVFVSADAPVYDVPMRVIHRPLQSYTTEAKVLQFMQDINNGDNFTPIEVLHVERGADDYYFAFGGCHRWEAHKRLNKASIKAKLIKTTPKSLSVYLGRDPFEKL